MMRISEMFTKPPRHLSPPKFTEGTLVDWEVVFRENEENFALSLRDNVLLETNWLKGVNENLDIFSERTKAYRAILVANEMKHPRNSQATEGSTERFIVEADPVVAAEKAFKKLNPSPSPSPLEST